MEKEEGKKKKKEKERCFCAFLRFDNHHFRVRHDINVNKIEQNRSVEDSISIFADFIDGDKKREFKIFVLLSSS